MKRLMIAAALCVVALSGCDQIGAVNSLPTPSTVAEKTTLDEKAGLAVDLAYQAANRAVFFAAKAGFLTPAQKAAAADIDADAYTAVQATRAAYKAGNATTYADAVSAALQAVARLQSLTK